MKVLVDTTIWSLALRRRTPGPREQVLIDELRELILESRAVLMGPIRQEILSGISSSKQFEEIRTHLANFDDLPLTVSDYEEAARVYNRCRQKGVQGSPIDFLICAVSLRQAAEVFTEDKDFANYAKHLDLKLYQPRGS